MNDVSASLDCLAEQFLAYKRALGVQYETGEYYLRNFLTYANSNNPTAFGGFEKDRETLKYRCPAKHYGIDCKGADVCPAASGIRIPLSEDRRIFTPLARSSYSWKTEYKKRTAVERVSSRLDVSFGFENHFIYNNANGSL
jgi:hypothetical protein